MEGREEKIALAKEKLNKFQKSRTTGILSSLSGHLMMSNSSHDDSKSHKSFYSHNSSPKRPNSTDIMMPISAFDKLAIDEDIPYGSHNDANGRRLSLQRERHHESDDVKMLLERIAILEKSIASYDQEKMDLLAANEDLKAHLADIHSPTLPSRMQSLQQELQIAISERDSLQQELDFRATQNMSSNSDIHELQTQLQEYQIMIENLQQGANEASQTIEELQNTKLLLEESIAGLKVDGEQSPQLLSLQKALDAHILTEKNLRSQITSLIFQVDKAEEEDTKNHQEIARLKGIVESQTVSLQELETKLFNVESDSSREIERLLNRIAELENAAAADNSSEPIQSRMLHYRSEAESFRKENQELKERLASLESKENAGDDQLIEELKMINEAHLEEIEQLKQQARRQQQAEDLKLVQLETEIEERDAIIDQLEGNAMHNIHTPSERSVELENLKKQMAALKEKHSKEISGFKSQIASLKSNGPENDALLVDELQAINDAQIEELQKAEREMKALKASHAQEIARLQANSAQNELLDSLQSLNEEQMFELETLRIKLSEQEQLSAEQLDNVKQEMKELESYYQAEIQALKNSGNSAEVQALKDEISQLKSQTSTDPELEYLQSTVDDQKAEIANLLFKIEALEAELLLPQEPENISTAELEFLQTTVDDQKVQIAELEKTVQEMRDSHYLEVRELAQRLEQMESPPDYSSVIKDLREENEALIIEVQSMRLEMQAKEDAAVSTLNLLNNAQEDIEVDELKLKHDNLAMDLEESEQEVLKLKDELEVVSGKYYTNLAKLTDLENSYAQLKHRCEIQDQALLSRKELIKEYEAELETLRGAQNDTTLLLDSMRELTKQNSSLKSEIETMGKRNVVETDLEEELRDERERVEELERIINSNGEQYELMIVEHEKQIIELQAEIEALKRISSESDYEAAFNESEERVLELEGVIEQNASQYQTILTNLETEKEEIMGKMSEIERQLNSALSQSEFLQQQLELLREERDDLSTRVESDKEYYEAEILRIRSETTHPDSRVGELELELDKSRAYYEELLKSESLAKSQLSHQLQNYVQESNQKDSEIYELQGTISGLREEIEFIQNELAEARLSVEVLTQKAEGYSFKSSLEEGERSSVNSLVSTLQVELEEARRAASEAQQQLHDFLSKDASHTQTPAGIQELEQLQANLAEAEEHIGQLEQVIQENSEKFESMLEEQARLRNGLLSQIDDLETKCAKTDDTVNGLREELSNLKNECQIKAATIEQLSQTLEGKDAEHQQELKSKRAELEQALLDYERGKIELEDLNQKLTDAINSAAQWEEYCSTTLAQQEEYYQTQMAELQNSLPEPTSMPGELSIELEKRISDLSEKLAAAQLERNDLNTQVLAEKESHQSELHELQSRLDDLNFRLEDQEKSHQSVVIHLQQELESAKRQFELSEQNNVSQNEKMSLQSRIVELETEITEILSKREAENSQFELMIQEKQQISEAINEIYSTAHLAVPEHQVDALWALVSFIGQMEAKLAEIENKSSLAENQIAELQNSLQEKELTIQEFTMHLQNQDVAAKTISELEGQKASLLLEVESYKAQLLVEEAKIVELQAAVASPVPDNNLESTQLKESLQQLIDEKTSLENTYSQLLSHDEELATQLNDANLVIEEWQTYVSNLESQKTEDQEKTKALQLEAEALRKHEEDLKSSINQYQTRIAELEDEISAYASKGDSSKLVEEMQAQLFAKDEELELLKNELLGLESIRARLEIVEEEKMQFQRELNDSSVSHNEKLLALEQNFLSLTAVKEEMEQKGEESSRLLEEYSGYIASLEAEKADFTYQYQELEAYATAQDAQVSQLGNEIQNLTSQIESLKAMESELKAKLDETNLAFEQSSATHQTEKIPQASVGHTTINNTSAEVEHLKKELENERLSSKRTIIQMQEEFDELAVLFQAATKQVEELRLGGNIPSILGVDSSFSLQERSALNNLAQSLKSEKESMLTELQTLSQRLEDTRILKDQAEYKLDGVLMQMDRLEGQIRVMEDDNRHLHSQLREADRIIDKTQVDLQKAIRDLQILDERCRLTENDRDSAIADRNRLRDQMEMELMAEQQRSRENLNFRLKELRSNYEMTFDEMQRKMNHLELLLDESEKTLFDERTIHYQREQTLIEDLRFLKSGSHFNGETPHFRPEFSPEKVHLDQRANELLAENRRLQRALDSQGNEFLRERHSLQSQIDILNQNLEVLESSHKSRDSARLATKVDEFKLSNKQMKRHLHNMPSSPNQRDTNLDIVYHEMVSVVSQLISATLGQSFQVESRVDLFKLKSQCSLLVQELLLLRILTKRSSLMRSDLLYQKKYLSLKLDDLELSNKKTLEFMQKKGFKLQIDEVNIRVAAQKWKKCIFAVIAVNRMRKMAHQWNSAIQDTQKNLFFDEEVEVPETPLLQKLRNSTQTRRLIEVS